MKFITLNVEFGKHTDLYVPYIKDNNFTEGIVCLQECTRSEYEDLKKDLHLQGIYLPLFIRRYESVDDEVGLAILTKHRVTETQIFYFHKNNESLFVYDNKSPFDNRGHRALLSAKIYDGRESYNIITTHFTRSRVASEDTELQSDHMKIVLDALAKRESFILAGDMNLARGISMLRQTLVTSYRDHTPVDIKTTIDQDLHRVKNLEIVVDGIFATDDIHVENVEVVCGLSDHCAIIADIAKI